MRSMEKILKHFNLVMVNRKLVNISKAATSEGSLILINCWKVMERFIFPYGYSLTVAIYKFSLTTTPLLYLWRSSFSLWNSSRFFDLDWIWANLFFNWIYPWMCLWICVVRVKTLLTLYFSMVKCRWPCWSNGAAIFVGLTHSTPRIFNLKYNCVLFYFLGGSL